LGARQDQEDRHCIDRSDRCPDWSDCCLQKGSKCPKPKKKARSSFNELLAKYKREGATKDRSNQPNGAKGIKAPPRHKGIHHQQGNFSQYPFVGSVMPSSWYYPCYYSPADYSSMYMNSYMIQYLIAYSNYNALQRPIVFNSNLVKVCTTIKQGENRNKQKAKEMQPRWCPLSLSHTQQRSLQRLRKWGAMEQQIEEKPAKSTRTRKERRPKQASSPTWVNYVYGRCCVKHRPKCFLILKSIFWHVYFARKIGGICWHSKLTPSRPGRTDQSDRSPTPIRPVLAPVAGPARHTGQTGVPNRSDQCPRVWDRSRNPDRIRLV
jgi:hypothetical protein